MRKLPTAVSHSHPPPQTVFVSPTAKPTGGSATCCSDRSEEFFFGVLLASYEPPSIWVEYLLQLKRLLNSGTYILYLMRCSIDFFAAWSCFKFKKPTSRV